jgi:hypothetical protein
MARTWDVQDLSNEKVKRAPWDSTHCQNVGGGDGYQSHQWLKLDTSGFENAARDTESRERGESVRKRRKASLQLLRPLHYDVSNDLVSGERAIFRRQSGVQVGYLRTLLRCIPFVISGKTVNGQLGDHLEGCPFDVGDWNGSWHSGVGQ